RSGDAVPGARCCQLGASAGAQAQIVYRIHECHPARPAACPAGTTLSELSAPALQHSPPIDNSARLELHRRIGVQSEFLRGEFHLPVAEWNNHALLEAQGLFAGRDLVLESGEECIAALADSSRVIESA